MGAAARSCVGAIATKFILLPSRVPGRRAESVGAVGGGGERSRPAQMTGLLPRLSTETARRAPRGGAAAGNEARPHPAARPKARRCARRSGVGRCARGRRWARAVEGRLGRRRRAQRCGAERGAAAWRGEKGRAAEWGGEVQGSVGRGGGWPRDADKQRRKACRGGLGVAVTWQHCGGLHLPPAFSPEGCVVRWSVYPRRPCLSSRQRATVDSKKSRCPDAASRSAEVVQ